jgi:hypothetical protein
MGHFICFDSKDTINIAPICCFTYASCPIQSNQSVTHIGCTIVYVISMDRNYNPRKPGYLERQFKLKELGKLVRGWRGFNGNRRDIVRL